MSAPVTMSRCTDDVASVGPYSVNHRHRSKNILHSPVDPRKLFAAQSKYVAVQRMHALALQMSRSYLAHRLGTVCRIVTLDAI